MLDLRPRLRHRRPVFERHEQGFRRQQQSRRLHVAGGRRRSRAPAGASFAGNDGVVIEGGEGDAALRIGAHRAGDVAHHLPAGYCHGGGLELSTGEMSRSNAHRRPADVRRVKLVRRARDPPILRRKQHAPIKVRRHLIHFHLERRHRLLGIHNLRQQRPVPTAEGNFPHIRAVRHRDGEIEDGGRSLAADYRGEVQFLVVRRLRAVYALGRVRYRRVSSSNDVYELASLPVPGEPPVIEPP